MKYLEFEKIVGNPNHKVFIVDECKPLVLYFDNNDSKLYCYPRKKEYLNVSDEKLKEIRKEVTSNFVSKIISIIAEQQNS